jgi:hypothetical protein
VRPLVPIEWTEPAELAASPVVPVVPETASRH